MIQQGLEDLYLIEIMSEHHDLKNILVGGLDWPTDLAQHLYFIIAGGLIIIFLILEPHGLAQLWRVAKEKLRLWPFPH